jgi:hypothetical protein
MAQIRHGRRLERSRRINADLHRFLAQIEYAVAGIRPGSPFPPAYSGIKLPGPMADSIMGPLMARKLGW